MFIATWLNCTLWFIYGYYENAFPIMLPNTIGSVLSIIYLTIVILHYFEKVITKLLVIVANLTVCFAIFTTFFWVMNEEYHCVTGIVAMVFNCVMYGSPGQNLVTFILTLVLSYQDQ
jgi:hypothetical protein